MSWFSWETSGITKIASNVVKNAQAKIDKVLDIHEDELDKEVSKTASPVVNDNAELSGTQGDFFDVWLSPNGSSSNRSASPGVSTAQTDILKNSEKQNSVSKSPTTIESQPHFSAINSQSISPQSDQKSATKNSFPDRESPDHEPSSDSGWLAAPEFPVEMMQSTKSTDGLGDWGLEKSMTASALDGNLTSQWFISSQIMQQTPGETSRGVDVDNTSSSIISPVLQIEDEQPPVSDLIPSDAILLDDQPKLTVISSATREETCLISADVSTTEQSTFLDTQPIPDNALPALIDTPDNQSDETVLCQQPNVPPQEELFDQEDRISLIHSRSSYVSMSSDCTSSTVRDMVGGLVDHASVDDMMGSGLGSDPTLTGSSSSSHDKMVINVTQVMTASCPVDTADKETPLPSALIVSCPDGLLSDNHVDMSESHENVTTAGDEVMVSSFVSMTSSDSFVKYGSEIPPISTTSVDILDKSSPTGSHGLPGISPPGCKDSDEVDTTTTSSDIEVISSCCSTSNNGDLQTGFLPAHKLYDSPLRHMSHKRSGSGSYLLLSRDISPPSDSNISHEELLKRLSMPSQDANEQKKYSDTTEILAVRENKLVQLSRENIDLREMNNILRQQLEQSEETRESEMTDLNTLTTEFTTRLADAEKRFQSASRERDQLKRRIQQIEAEVTAKSEDKRGERLLREKEEQISELMREGEKMAQNHLKSNTIIKKLRIKEKELETTIESKTDQVEKLQYEVEHLKKVLDNKLDNEKQHVEGIKQLTKAVQKQEKELLKLKTDHEESVEKNRSLQTTLDACSKELTESQKLRWESESTIVALKTELSSLEESRSSVTAHQASWKEEKEALKAQTEELRLALSRQEREAARTEDQLRNEITYFQSRLASAEERNEELSHCATAATQPVLRQLESLQSNFLAQNANWQHAEQALNERLSDYQKRLASAVEQEKLCREQCSQLETTVATQETQLTALRQEKSKLAVQVQTLQSRNHLMEEEREKIMVQFEGQKNSLERQLNEVKKEVLFLKNTLSLEKHKLEGEKQKYNTLSSQLTDVQKQLYQAQSSASSTPARHNSGSSTPTGIPYQRSGSTSDDNWAPSRPSISSSILQESVYEVVRGHGTAATMEQLQASLKRKDGEIGQLHAELRQQERSRDSLLAEMSKQTERCEALREDVKRLESKVAHMGDVEGRHAALLLMYGEKMEENEELKLDLRDIKEMYKSQINMLLQDR